MKNFFYLFLLVFLVSCESKKGLNIDPKDAVAVNEQATEEQVVKKDTKNDVVLNNLYYFAFDSANLSAEAKTKIKGFVAGLIGVNVIAKNKDLKGVSLTLTGYCDDRGTKAYNYVLGKKRAESVAKYLKLELQKKNVKLKNVKIIIKSKGKEDPAVPNATTEEEHAKNRRVVIE